MAYLNKTTQVLKAILTNKGREKLAQGQFNVSHFALADDEIDYTLWDTAHPSGSDYYGTVIENLPLFICLIINSNCQSCSCTRH